MEHSFLENYKAGKTQLLHDWIVSDLDTPVSVFLKLAEKEDYSFLLESVEGGEQLGRYTIIGYDPDIVWTCKDYRTHQSNPLDDLRNLLNQSRIDVSDETLPPMATSGLFGYIGYDIIRVAERIPDTNPDPLDIPDSIFVRPRILVIFDNVKHKICIVTPIYTHAANSDTPAEKALSEARARLEQVKEKIRTPILISSQQSKFPTLPEPASNMSKQDYFSMIEKGKEYIRAGDIFQFVPSQRFTTDFDLPAFDLYRSLRRLNPSPFLFYIKYPDFSLIGSSPEILVRVRDGKVTIRPIAGTLPRGANAEEDQKLKAALLSDPKELAEHLMLLDLGRNDVGKVSKIGSVKVTEQFFVEFYSHVMHIVSNVEGDLRDDLDSLDALMSGTPAGTVSGAPKIRAMEIIDALEPTKRKFYGGGVGYLAANGNIDSCIALRTCVVKDGKLYVQAGGGVVADSIPENEFQETVNKSKAILRAADDAIISSRKN
ncbi:MAG TPA: anthranilate synthase component I [Alphaproteobacteria bacterium]|nr:anthranilate synthase component I [Alphaproteobacteria bacterium]HNS44250.1 anthranilate synthase component I [Alphaproteobacteria bacterium]